MKKKEIILLAIFLALLIAFVVTAKQTVFHDAPELYNLVKAFAGHANINAHSVHSMVYTYFLSYFVEIVPSLITIKIINVLWLFFIAFLLYWYNYKKAFLLFIFSPVVWYIAPQLTNIMPAAFYTTVAYLEIKRWQKDRKLRHLLFVGLALGATYAVYSAMFLIIPLFLICFMRNVKLKELIPTTIAGLISYIPRPLLDFQLTHIPFYSEIRYFGNNLKAVLGLNQNGNPDMLLKLVKPQALFNALLISPLFFFIVRIDYKKYLNELIFLAISTVYFLGTRAGVKYMLIVIPIFYILLATVLTKKTMKWNIFLSLALIALVITPYMVSPEGNYASDFEEIKKDYDIDGAVMRPDVALFYWGEEKFVLPEEYGINRNNETIFSTFGIESQPIYDSDKILRINLDLYLTEPIDTSNTNIWIAKDDKKVPEEFVKDKCYQALCVFKKNEALLLS